MLRPDDPWFLDEAVDEAGELLKALPEIRQYVVPAPPEEELGSSTASAASTPLEPRVAP